MHYLPHAVKRFNFSYLLNSITNFSIQHQVSQTILGPAFLLAAEDFYAEYHRQRFNKTLGIKHVLIDPNNLNLTPVAVKFYSNSKNLQAKNFTARFIFPLAHRHLDLIEHGYAQDVLTAFVNHALKKEPIPQQNPLEPAVVKFKRHGNIISESIPIEITTQRIFPVLGQEYLPRFSQHSKSRFALQNELNRDVSGLVIKPSPKV